jgi:hypothetical protein
MDYTAFMTPNAQIQQAGATALDYRRTYVCAGSGETAS